MADVKEGVTDMSIDRQVADYLKKIGVTIEPTYIGERLTGDWQHDLFTVSLNDKHHTEYKTGLGHRISSNSETFSTSLSRRDQDKLKLLRVCYPDKRQIKYTPKTKVFNGGRASQIQYVLLPTQASILYCLLVDMQAGEQPFSDWCGDFGYSDDSIESLNIYQACEKINKQLRDVFKREHIEHLKQLLEVY